MKSAYPVFIAEHNNDFLVFVPDFEIYTEGKSMTDAMEMARDAIGLKGIDYQDDGKELPEASNYNEAMAIAKADTEIFDYSQGIITMVDIDFSEYRKRHNNRMVKKNCTIPSWLNFEAEKAGVNFSAILTAALKSELKIQSR